MPRDIDEKKKSKALRKLRKAAEQAEANGAELSDWEREFIDEVEERVETYGSAFHDAEKGALDEPLSIRQQMKLKEIDRKARGKGGFKNKRSSLKSKKAPFQKSNSRDINEDVEADVTEPSKSEQRDETIARLVSKSEGSIKRASKTETEDENVARPSRPSFRLIDGGKSGDEDRS